MIFGALTLVTGSIWAKISWGVWWIWSERQLVLFLVLFLFYSAYFMLRFSVEPGPQRANLSRRLRALRRRADPDQLPRDPARRATSSTRSSFTRDGPQMAGLACSSTFCVCLAAMLALAATLYQIELAGKRLDAQPARAAGAARVTTAEKYVAAAYLVVFVVVLVYVADHRARSSRGSSARSAS